MLHLDFRRIITEISARSGNTQSFINQLKPEIYASTQNEGPVEHICNENNIDKHGELIISEIRVMEFTANDNTSRYSIKKSFKRGTNK